MITGGGFANKRENFEGVHLFMKLFIPRAVEVATWFERRTLVKNWYIRVIPLFFSS